MCGRFTLRASREQIAALFQLPLEQVPPLAPRYNIAPTQPVLALRVPHTTGHKELTFLNWGLIPFWADDPKIGNRMINARAESVADRPAFRAAFRYRRCLIPADGFYEWRKVNGRKQPYLIQHRDASPFAFAGLWEHWEREGSVIESCTIITVPPNPLVAELHDRMPAILPEEDYALWLDPHVQDKRRLLPLLRPYPAERLEAFPVSPRVNNPRNDDPDLVVPLKDA